MPLFAIGRAGISAAGKLKRTVSAKRDQSAIACGVPAAGGQNTRRDDVRPGDGNTAAGADLTRVSHHAGRLTEGHRI